MAIPVILDTDIGSDIDDTWALALLLKCPELDLKLVVSATGDTVHRAALAAKLLEALGRADVPVGIGVRQCEDPNGPQAPWVAGYDLQRYPGVVHQDGVGAMIDAIMESPEPVTLIGIGPTTNLGALLDREPRVAGRVRFVGMYGDLRGGYLGNPNPVAEWNVKCDLPASKKVFTAPWDMTITPLDTCGVVLLKGEKYRAVRECRSVLAKTVIENFEVWARTIKWLDRWGPRPTPETMTTVLYDTVAVYLAMTSDLVEMEDLGIRVGDDGMLLIDDRAKAVHCATKWRDLAAFEDWMVERMVTEKL